MTIKKARIAVIGTGWWGTEYHLPGIQSHPDAEVAAICDTQPKRLKVAASAFGIKRTYASYQKMLQNESLDGAIVVTPHSTHYAIARQCLEHNLHVLVEKPLTLVASEARNLVQTARRRRLTLMVGYPYHYLPHTLRARQAVGSGEMGPVQYVVSSFASSVIGFLQGKVSPSNPPTRFTVQGPGEDYNRPEMLGGGQGHLQITHSAALMLFITGLRVNQVSAHMNNYGLPVDLVDAMSIQFEGGAVGIVGGTANSGGAYNVQIGVYCAQGAYTADTLAGHAALWVNNRAREDLSPLMQGNQPFAVTHNFINAILKREANGSPGEIGLRTVELLEAAYRSAIHNGLPVQVSELYPD